MQSGPYTAYFSILTVINIICELNNPRHTVILKNSIVGIVQNAGNQCFQSCNLSWEYVPMKVFC